MRLFYVIAFIVLGCFLSSCEGPSAGGALKPKLLKPIKTGGAPNMGGPTAEQRAKDIANEPKGDFYYGRRYYVKKTRFWGYLRKPGESANKAKLVIFNESRKLNPDRYSEVGPPGRRFGFDNNYEYRIRGYYTGNYVYEVYTNQILPEFMLEGYDLISARPGWLFSPNDHYNENLLTLGPNN